MAVVPADTKELTLLMPIQTFEQPVGVGVTVGVDVYPVSFGVSVWVNVEVGVLV
jgi:hypothetical protein